MATSLASQDGCAMGGPSYLVDSINDDVLELIEGTLLSRVINDRGDGAANAEYGEDDCVWSFDKNVGQAKLLAHQIADLAETI